MPARKRATPPSAPPSGVQRRRAPAAMTAGKKGAMAPMAELGGTGLRHYGGRIYEEFLGDLTGLQGIRTYSEMRDNDPIIGAILFALKMLMREVEWHVKPASEATKHTAAADFLESCLNDMSQSWEDTLSEILSFLVFGWSFHEIVYKKRVGPTETDPRKRSRFTDGRIGWRKLPIRSQDSLLRWEFQDDGGVKALVQLCPPTFEEFTIPIEKALLFRTELSKGSPEGRSVLRNAYRPYYFKKKFEEIEAIGVERDLAGLPQLKAPENIDIFDKTNPDMVLLKQECDNLVQNIRRDQAEGLVLPFGWEFILTTTGGRRALDINQIIQRKQFEMAVTVLADFLTIGHERNGSRAVSGDKTEMFNVALGAWLDLIADVFNRHGIPRLFALNPEFPQDKLPTLEHGPIDDVDIQKLGAFLASTVGAGVIIPDAALEQYTRTAAHLPEADDDDPVRQAALEQKQMAAQQSQQLIEQNDLNLRQQTQQIAAQDEADAKPKKPGAQGAAQQSGGKGGAPVQKADITEAYIDFDKLAPEQQAALAKALGFILV